MRILKYVINEKEFPIIFNRETLHSDIYTNAIAAGFVIINFDYTRESFFVKCYGESCELHVESRPIDATIIERYLNESKEDSFGFFK
jgi:hypothetical protein